MTTTKSLGFCTVYKLLLKLYKDSILQMEKIYNIKYSGFLNINSQFNNKISQLKGKNQTIHFNILLDHRSFRIGFLWLNPIWKKRKR